MKIILIKILPENLSILTNATHKYYQNETVVVSEKNRQC